MLRLRFFFLLLLRYCSFTYHVTIFIQGSDLVSAPLHLEVSRASQSAIDAIERAGGKVHTRYYPAHAIIVMRRPSTEEEDYNKVRSREYLPPPHLRDAYPSAAAAPAPVSA